MAIRRSCSVLNCQNQHFTKFKVPLDPDKREKWLSALKEHLSEKALKNLTKSKIIYICAKHFDAKDLYYFTQSGVNTCRLVPDAVPCIFEINATAEETAEEGSLDNTQELGFAYRTISAGSATHSDSSAMGQIGAPLASSTPRAKKRIELNDSSVDNKASTTDGSWFSQSMQHDVSAGQVNVDLDTFFRERKFIWTESQLRKLCSHCPCCGQSVQPDVIGEGLGCRVDRVCPTTGDCYSVSSQPRLGRKLGLTVLFSLALLFTASSAKKVLRLMDLMSLGSIHYTTYHTIQQSVGLRAIFQFWRDQQAALFDSLGSRPLSLAGDGRCDSPGHSAKYGTYTFMDTTTSKIVHVEQIQCNQSGVRGSTGMELRGFLDGLQFLQNCGFVIQEMVTDRHVQIRHALKSLPIEHFFDIWHVAKGLTKKLLKVSSGPANNIIRAWIPSVTRHLYYCAQKANGNVQLLESMWLSILNHVANVHEGHGALYPRCRHELTEKKVWWMRKGTVVYRKFRAVVTNCRLLKDIRMLSPRHQTFNLEAFHSLLIKFAPKSQHFTYPVMFARTLLAVFHHNENTGKPQKIGKDGQPLFTQRTSKACAGRFSLYKVREEATYEYAQSLLKLGLRFALDGTYKENMEAAAALVGWTEQPRNLVDEYDRPTKAAMIQSNQTRFFASNSCVNLWMQAVRDASLEVEDE